MCRTGVVVFNAPGANANAVKELCLTGMLLAARNVPAGLAWASTLTGTEGVGKAVEKARVSLPEQKSKARL